VISTGARRGERSLGTVLKISVLYAPALVEARAIFMHNSMGRNVISFDAHETTTTFLLFLLNWSVFHRLNQVIGRDPVSR